MMVAVTAAVLALAGCDKAEDVVNRGGDTPCNEFVAQDRDKQEMTVRKYLQKDTELATPSSQDIAGAISVIDPMCRAQSDTETPIRNADLSGILPPR